MHFIKLYTENDSKIGISAAPKPRDSTIAKGASINFNTTPFAIDRIAGAFASAQMPIFESFSVYNPEVYLAALPCSKNEKKTFLKYFLGTNIQYGPYGKPYHPTIHFNTSDSKDITVFAFSFHYEVGIDIEYQDPSFDYESILSDVLTLTELEQFHTFPEHEKRKLFFDLWVAKEAYLKCKGTGLLAPLHTIEFEILTSKQLNLKNKDAQYQSLELFPDYSCALAFTSKMVHFDVPIF